MAKLINFGDNIVDANEIVWLDAIQTDYKTFQNEYKISYYLRGNSINFTISFREDKESRDNKYLEIKEAMELR